MTTKLLSIIIPVYNEKDTVKECIERVLKADTCGLTLNIIVSDNNSTDGTKEILKSINDEKVKCYFKEKNEGKGSNIKNALQYAFGDLILFQDAPGRVNAMHNIIIPSLFWILAPIPVYYILLFFIKGFRKTD